jgi:shikimate dehydrogenase
LARHFEREFPSDGIEAHGLGLLTQHERLAEAALIINATSLGLKGGEFAPLDYSATSPDCLFYDLIYARQPTAFLQPAQRLGRRSLDGAGMLVNQGEMAFELFNGAAPPKGVMRQALMTALGRDSQPASARSHPA